MSKATDQTSQPAISEAEIQKHLDFELAQTSIQASINFILSSLFYAWMTFENLPDYYHQTASALTIFASIVRFRIGKKAVKMGYLTDQDRRTLYTAIFLNTFFSGAQFFIITYQTGYTHWHAIGPLLGYVAFLTGGTFTLSYNKKLLNFMVFSWTGSQSALLLYQNWVEPIEKQYFYLYIFAQATLFLYAFKQGSNYHRFSVDRIKNQILLKITNQELIATQGQLVQHMAVAQNKNRLSALGEMAGGVAHEINTPLAVIQMRAETALESLEGDQIDKTVVKNSLNAIDQTVKRISKIVRGLRFFARDTATDPMIPYSVNHIVEGTFDLCQEKFATTGITLKYFSDNDVMIDCRPSQLSQVLLNLLTNSFDAIEKFPEKWIDVEIRELNEEIELRVTDSGNGIPKEIQEKMMNPFFTTKEVGKGTGLGLSICRGIVEDHGGKLEIDNTRKNTSIFFTLRKKHATSAAS